MNKISSLSDNAILAKSRAMTCDILKAEDYSALTNSRNLSETVSYLKNRTVYSNAISSLSSINIHRSRLEAEIRKFNLERTANLASFENAVGQKMHRIIFLNYDVNLILSCADHLDTNKVSDFSLFTPQAYFKNSQLNPTALEKAMSFEEFYEALSGTCYQKPLDIFKNGNASFTITALENALYQYLGSETKRVIKKNYSGNAKKELLELFEMKSDFKMIESIYRMKKYFPDIKLDYSNIFYTGFSALSLEEITDLTNAKNVNEFFRLCKGTKYGKFLDEQYKDRIELCTHTAQFKINKKNLRFSTTPEVVMFSFMGLLENETKNLIHIIEGVRYELPPDEIKKFLIYSDNEN